MRQVERAKYAFLEAVAMGRNGRLQIDADTLSRAEIYSGVRAWELGLVDELAATDEAVARAAELAGFKEYDVVEVYPLAFDADGQYAFGAYQPPPLDAAKLWANPTHLPPGLYYRHLELPANR
jgi:protease-4